jgi:hypothetical protein
MITIEQLLRDYPNYALPTQYRVGGVHGRTTLCFQNFYQQVFPDKDAPVDLYVLSFDTTGNQIEGVHLAVATGEAVQYQPDARGPGLVAAMAAPAFDLESYSAGRLKLRDELGTGFYVIWEDATGHLDTMHEWMQVRTNSAPATRHYMVFDPAQGALTRAGLVVTNPHFGGGLDTRAAVTLYSRNRERLGQCALPAIVPMGVRLIFLDELFPDVAAWFARYGALGLRIDGTNLVEPLTAEFHASGDLHLHHIN